jgi:tetratricopeptide (TPR) repeat protein
MRSIGALALLPCLTVPGPGRADWWADATLCSDRSARPDTRINACASIIQSNETPAVNLAVAYNNWALAYAEKGEFGFAVRDYDEALRRDPALGRAYGGRGRAHQALGDQDKAIRALDEALRLDPENVTVYWHRGLARYHQEEFEAAAPNLERAAATIWPSADGILWRYLALARGTQRTNLAAAAVDIDLGAWPGPIVAIFLGRALPAELQRAAEDPYPVRRRDQTCQAVFFIDQQLLLLGKKDEGMPLFE